HVVAGVFGVDPGQVRLNPTNTDSVANAPATAGSASIDLYVRATLAACEAIKERLYVFIEEKWNVPRARIEFHDGHVQIGHRNVDFGEIAEDAWQEHVPLSAT